MINRSTLRSQIAAALRDEILAGRLATGREFTVKEIAEQYGVSATPVREALVDLAAQGLLDMEQHRGFRVHEFTLDDYRAMCEARQLVAATVFQGCLPEGGPKEPPPPGVVASVRRRAEAAERAARAGDLDVLIAYDLRFWRELCAVSANPYIADFLDRLRVQCWVCAVPLLRERASLKGDLWAGHTALLEALLRGDEAETGRILADYHAHALTLM
ncbi:GntR family transcriptional regulator [Streptomyces boncukensis]|uniref:GntR family transcriptional regulator n=1 Tax=Streptomyces boncukensis TaxID=2711219 RepID=UPI0030B9F0A6